jgi:uncharacterized membrane protein YedE/YeeE
MIAGRCPWYIAGPLLGLLIVLLRAAVNRPLGSLGGYIEIVNRVSGTARLGFSAYLLTGAVLGGLAYAAVAGTSALTWSYGGTLLGTGPSAQFAVLALAGLAMGVGARTAGGCTSGHGITGVSLGSPASLIATMTFFATAVALANGFAWLLGGQP